MAWLFVLLAEQRKTLPPRYPGRAVVLHWSGTLVGGKEVVVGEGRGGEIFRKGSCCVGGLVCVTDGWWVAADCKSLNVLEH